MKRIVLFLFVFFCICTDTYSQNPKDTFRIVLTADSHGESYPPGGYDSLWITRLYREYQKYYPTVILTNLSIGGTQIQDVMPSWYYETDTRLNIDTCLSYNPDLIIISQSGNHSIYGVDPDTSIYCFKYLIDTLNSLGKRFVITGQAPRQKTFSPPTVTLDTYYDDSQDINDFLRSYIPNSFTDPYLTMEDTVIGKYPWPAVLRVDSLHFSDYGSRLYYECNINNKTIDSTLSDFKGQALNFVVRKSGGNILISGACKYRKIYVYGSNDNSTFVLLQTYTSSSAYLQSVSKSFSDYGYLWYKFVIYSGRKLQTKTLKLN